MYLESLSRVLAAVIFGNSIMRLLGSPTQFSKPSSSRAETDKSYDDVPEQTEDPRELAVLADKAAARYSKEFEASSRLMRMAIRGAKRPCQVKWTDLRVGNLLGTGGFSEVNNVEVLKCSCSKRFGMSTCAKIHGNYYAVKLLKESIKGKRKTFVEGAVDLVNEAKLLTYLKHENIIHICGLAQGDLSSSYRDGRFYFVIIERLPETLVDVLKRYKVEEDRSKLGYSVRRKSGGPCLTPTQKLLQTKRLKDISLPLATAMTYLHKKHVLYRDLKPTNVGFDAKGCLKLFDFGLAREILDENRKMTAKTGSIRYMAPEVANGRHYGFPADVYSFGVFFWEIVTLEKAYGGMKKTSFQNLVVGGDVRQIGRAHV